jgi:7,8-dihydroneopterin aldolase/epimerase/oxygenase
VAGFFKSATYQSGTFNFYLMCTLQLNAIHLRPIIGVHPEERLRRQDIYVDITADFNRLERTDSLESTLDYCPLVQEIEQLEETFRPELIETFAEEVAVICLKRKSVLSVMVSITKPAALSNGVAKVVISKART